MGADIIPYDPYHPHLGYTLLVTCLAWIGVGLYSQSFLRRSPHTRTILCALAIMLPIYAEATAFVINRLRPEPNTRIGYVLTHIHAYVIQRIPIDSFLSPTAGEIVLILLTGILIGSLARFLIGTYQLNRALVSAVPIARTEHAHLAADLAATDATRTHMLPEIFVSDVDAPLAFTTGMLFPRIYITNSLIGLLAHDEMIAVLCHEWAHVLRRDNLWNWLVRLLRDVGWFLPGSHIAWHSMVASQDEACDALAASMTRQPLALARALVKVAGAWNLTTPRLRMVNSFACASITPRARVEQMIWLSSETIVLKRSVATGAHTLAALLLLLAPLPALLGS
jgi:beta-lactamase regulating signal transducer with metallopeptidase domain